MAFMPLDEAMRQGLFDAGEPSTWDKPTAPDTDWDVPAFSDPRLNARRAAIPEEDFEAGYFSNLGRGVLQSVTRSLGDVAKTTIADPLQNAEVAARQTIAELKDSTSSFDRFAGDLLSMLDYEFGYFKDGEGLGKFIRTPEQNQADLQSGEGPEDAITALAELYREADAGYRPGTTTEDIKQSWEEGDVLGLLGDIANFSVEQMAANAGEIAAIATNPTAGFLAISGRLAQARAEADGRETANAADMMVASLAAPVILSSERFGLSAILPARWSERLGIDPMTFATQGLLKGAAVRGTAGLATEAGTEAFQEGLVEYPAETLGTKEGFDPAKVPERALFGALGGGPVGGALGVVSGAAEGYANKRRAAIMDEVDVATAGRVDSAEADALNLKLNEEAPATEPVPIPPTAGVEALGELQRGAEGARAQPQTARQGEYFDQIDQLAGGAPTAAAPDQTSEYAQQVAGLAEPAIPMEPPQRFEPSFEERMGRPPTPTGQGQLDLQGGQAGMEELRLEAETLVGLLDRVDPEDRQSILQRLSEIEQELFAEYAQQAAPDTPEGRQRALAQTTTASGMAPLPEVAERAPGEMESPAMVRAQLEELVDNEDPRTGVFVSKETLDNLDFELDGYTVLPTEGGAIITSRQQREQAMGYEQAGQRNLMMGATAPLSETNPEEGVDVVLGKDGSIRSYAGVPVSEDAQLDQMEVFEGRANRAGGQYVRMPYNEFLRLRREQANTGPAARRAAARRRGAAMAKAAGDRDRRPVDRNEDQAVDIGTGVDYQQSLPFGEPTVTRSGIKKQIAALKRRWYATPLDQVEERKRLRGEIKQAEKLLAEKDWKVTETEEVTGEQRTKTYGPGPEQEAKLEARKEARKARESLPKLRAVLRAVEDQIKALTEERAELSERIGTSKKKTGLRLQRALLAEEIEKAVEQVLTLQQGIEDALKAADAPGGRSVIEELKRRGITIAEAMNVEPTVEHLRNRISEAWGPEIERMTRTSVLTETVEGEDGSTYERSIPGTETVSGSTLDEGYSAGWGPVTIAHLRVAAAEKAEMRTDDSGRYTYTGESFLRERETAQSHVVMLRGQLADIDAQPDPVRVVRKLGKRELRKPGEDSQPLHQLTKADAERASNIINQLASNITSRVVKQGNKYRVEVEYLGEIGVQMNPDGTVKFYDKEKLNPAHTYRRIDVGDQSFYARVLYAPRHKIAERLKEAEKAVAEAEKKIAKQRVKRGAEKLSKVQAEFAESVREYYNSISEALPLDEARAMFREILSLERMAGRAPNTFAQMRRFVQNYRPKPGTTREGESRVTAVQVSKLRRWMRTVESTLETMAEQEDRKAEVRRRTKMNKATRARFDEREEARQRELTEQRENLDRIKKRLTAVEKQVERQRRIRHQWRGSVAKTRAVTLLEPQDVLDLYVEVLSTRKGDPEHIVKGSSNAEVESKLLTLGFRDKIERNARAVATTKAEATKLANAYKKRLITDLKTLAGSRRKRTVNGQNMWMVLDRQGMLEAAMNFLAETKNNNPDYNLGAFPELVKQALGRNESLIVQRAEDAEAAFNEAEDVKASVPEVPDLIGMHLKPRLALDAKARTAMTEQVRKLTSLIDADDPYASDEGGGLTPEQRAAGAADRLDELNLKLSAGQMAREDYIRSVADVLKNLQSVLVKAYSRTYTDFPLIMRETNIADTNYQFERIAQVLIDKFVAHNLNDQAGLMASVRERVAGPEFTRYPVTYWRNLIRDAVVDAQAEVGARTERQIARETKARQPEISQRFDAAAMLETLSDMGWTEEELSEIAALQKGATREEKREAKGVLSEEDRLREQLVTNKRNADPTDDTAAAVAAEEEADGQDGGDERGGELQREAGGTGRRGPRAKSEVIAKAPRPASATQHVKRDTFDGAPLDEEQVEGINYAVDQMLKAAGRFMLGDGTGFGKTAQMLATAATLVRKGKRVAILVPGKRVRDGFMNDTRKFGIPLQGIDLVTHEDFLEGKGVDGPRGYDAILIDEGQNFGNPFSQRGAKLIDWTKANPDLSIMMASATPADRIESLGVLMQMHRMTLDELADALGLASLKPMGTSEKSVRVEFRDDTDEGVVVERLAKLVEKSIKNREMLVRRYPYRHKLHTHKVDALLPKGVLHGAPPGVRPAHYLDKGVMASARGRDKINQSGYIAETTRMHWLAKQIPQMLNEGRKIIVMANTHKGSLQITMPNGDTVALPGGLAQLKEWLDTSGYKGRYAEAYGSGNTGRTGRAIDRFNQDDSNVDILLTTYDSGGVGIHLDDKTGKHPRSLILMQPPYSAVKFDQALGRVDRRDSVTAADVHLLYSPDITGDARRRDILRRKTPVLNRLRGMPAEGLLSGDAFRTQAQVDEALAEEPTKAKQVAEAEIDPIYLRSPAVKRGMAVMKGLIDRGAPMTLKDVNAALLSDPEIARSHIGTILRLLERADIDLVVNFHSLPDGAAGEFNFRLRDEAGQSMAISPEAPYPLFTFLHEQVHAATMAGMHRDNVFAQDIEALRLVVLQAFKFRHPKRKLPYGLTNANEFLAEAISSPTFQHLLISINDPKSGSMFQRFVQSIRRFFARLAGRPMPIKGTVLETILRAAPKSVLSPGMRAVERTRIRGGAETYFDLSQAGKDMQKTAIARSIQSMFDDRSATLAERVMDGLMPVTKAVMETIRETGRRYAKLPLLTMRQIAKSYGHLFNVPDGDNPLMQFSAKLGEKEQRTRQLQAEFTTIVRQWTDFTRSHPRLAKDLNKIMGQATVWGIDPREEFGVGVNEHLLSEDQKTLDNNRERYARIVGAYNTMAEATPEAKAIFDKVADTFNEKWDTSVRVIKQNLIRRFLAGTGYEPSKVALDKVDMMENADTVREFMRNQLRIEQKDLEDDPDIQTLETVLLNVVARQGVQGIYFPLRRWGEWVVSATRKIDLDYVKKAGVDRLEGLTYKMAKQAMSRIKSFDPTLQVAMEKVTSAQFEGEVSYKLNIESRVVEFFDTHAEANRFDAKMRTTGQWQVRGPRMRREFYEESAVTGNAYRAVERKLAKSPAALNAFRQSVIEMMPETSMRKAELARSNVEGFNEDMLRAFASYGRSYSHHIAQLEHGLDIARAVEAMDDVAQEAAVNRGDQSLKMQQVVNEIKLRERQDAVYSDPAYQKLTEIGFLWYLASPSYWMVNSSQVAVVTTPWLAARFGEGMDAGRAVRDAYRAISPEIMRRMGEVKGGLGFMQGKRVTADIFDFLQGGETLIKEFADSIKNSGVTVGKADAKASAAELIAMLEAIGKTGLIDLTFAADLRAVAEGRGNWDAVMEWARVMPHLTEVMNRSVTGIAAYKMARDSGLAEGASIEVAKDAIASTQFDYSAANKARYMSDRQWKLARPITMFMQHSQHMYVLLLRSMMQAYLPAKAKLEGRELTTEEKQAAARGLKTFLLTTASHMLVAGTVGGLFEPLKWAIGMAAYMLEALVPGDDDWDLETEWRNMLAAMFGKDIAEVVARGLPRAVGLDASTRINLDRLVGRWSVAGTRNPEEALGRMILDTLGPLPAMGLSIAEGAGALMDGDFLTVGEKMLPKGFRDPFKAAKMLDAGYTDVNGNEIRPPEDVTPLDLFYQTIGFRAGRGAEIAAGRRAETRARNHYRDMKSEFMEAFREAETPAERREIWAEAQEYNASLDPEERRFAGVSLGEMIRAANRKEKATKRMQQMGAYTGLTPEQMYLTGASAFVNE